MYTTLPVPDSVSFQRIFRFLPQVCRFDPKVAISHSSNRSLVSLTERRTFERHCIWHRHHRAWLWRHLTLFQRHGLAALRRAVLIEDPNRDLARMIVFELPKKDQNVWCCDPNTVGIRIANIPITETFELRTFTCSVFKWFSIQTTIRIPNCY